MNAFKLRLLSIFMLASLLATLPTFQARAFETVIRVTLNPPITKLCGGSWTRACGLQQALNLAAVGDQIWIKAGTYKPTTGTDRTISFTLKDGVAVYGGFAGNETILKQRDPGANVTILSGDIGVRDDISDNSYHVVVTNGTGSSTLLDGVTITGGTADGLIASDYDKGAGLLNLNGSPTLRNLIISENYSENYGSNLTGSGSGGGMHSTGDPTIEKVIFSRNQTGDNGRGGGLYSVGNPLITDVTFQENWGGAGGGLASMGIPTLTNVTFSDNGAYNGGGMLNESFTYGAAVLTNVTFSDNTVCHNGAALYSSGDATLTNVTISGNHALKHRGGGILISYGSLIVRNAILWGNTALIEGPQVYVDSSATADIRYSVVEGGCPAGSSCSNIITSNPKLATLGDNGGFTQTMPLLPNSPAIDQGNNLSCPSSDQRGVDRHQGRGCDIGAYEVLDPVGPGIYDDTDPAWIYNGEWIVSSDNGAYNNTLHQTMTADDFALMTFSGVQITLTYWTGPKRGSFEVVIDRHRVDTIDANTMMTSSATWTSPILSAGVHTVYFVAADRGLVDIDAIQVFDTPSIPPGPATLVSPSGSITNANPTYSWIPVNGSSWYQLSVSGPSGYTFAQWYEASNVCSGSTCSIGGATPDLVGGTYTWKIQTWNAAGNGPLSADMSFTVTPPGPATLISPNGSSGTNLPTYTWQDVNGSTWYELFVSGPSGMVIDQWYTSTDTHCNGSTCWFTPTTALANGAYTWRIRTWNSAGNGAWSTDMNFTAP